MGRRKRSKSNLHKSSYTGPVPFLGAGDFSGAEQNAFIRNAYIVYPQGLNNEKPNPIAVSEATHTKTTMGFRSSNELTGLNYLFNFLKDLAARERAKENKYLDEKLKQLRDNTPEFLKQTNTLKALDEIIKHQRLKPSESAGGDTISSAFTLLLNSQGYNELIRQLKTKQNNGGVAHGNDVYSFLCRDVFKETYEKYKKNYANIISVNEKTGGFTYRGTVTDAINSKNGLDAMSANFIEDFTNGVLKKFHGLIDDEEEYRNKIRREMNFYLKNEGFILGQGNRYTKTMDLEEDDFLTGAEYTRIRNRYKKNKLENENEKELAKKLNTAFVIKRTDKRQKAKEIHTIMDELIAKAMGNFMADLGEKMAGANKDTLSFIFKQMGQEQNRRRSFSDVASGTSHTRTETTDSFIFDSLGVEIDINVIQKLFKSMVLQDSKLLEDEIKQLITDIKKLDEFEKKFRESFKIHINTKTYKSQFNLKIVNKNNLENLTGKFKELSEHFYALGTNAYAGGNSTKGYHDTHLARMFDSLVFMLNNTVEGASFSEDIETVKSLISFNCCMWMWDGMTESIKDIEGDINGDNNIHIFQSGGAFFTVSDLLYEIVNIFENYFAGEPVDSYLVTEIEPGISLTSAQAMYSRMKEFYPYKEPDKPNSYENSQKQLQKRWKFIRDEGLHSTKLSIKFRQQAIDKLLGRLSMLRVKGI